MKSSHEPRAPYFISIDHLFRTCPILIPSNPVSLIVSPTRPNPPIFISLLFLFSQADKFHANTVLPSLYTFKSLSGPLVPPFPSNFYRFFSRLLSSDNLSSIRAPISPPPPNPAVSSHSHFPTAVFHERSHFVVRFISTSSTSSSHSVLPHVQSLQDFPFCGHPFADTRVTRFENVRYCHRREKSLNGGMSRRENSLVRFPRGTRTNRYVFRFNEIHGRRESQSRERISFFSSPRIAERVA